MDRSKRLLAEAEQLRSLLKDVGKKLVMAQCADVEFADGWDYHCEEIFAYGAELGVAIANKKTARRMAARVPMPWGMSRDAARGAALRFLADWSRRNPLGGLPEGCTIEANELAVPRDFFDCGAVTAPKI